MKVRKNLLYGLVMVVSIAFMAAFSLGSLDMRSQGSEIEISDKSLGYGDMDSLVALSGQQDSVFAGRPAACAEDSSCEPGPTMTCCWTTTQGSYQASCQGPDGGPGTWGPTVFCGSAATCTSQGVGGSCDKWGDDDHTY